MIMLELLGATMVATMIGLGVWTYLERTEWKNNKKGRRK